MLNFIDHFYEVTEANRSILCQLIQQYDIRRYNGDPINVDNFVTVGRVLGNNRNDNPKQCGYWSSTATMSHDELQQRTTDVCKPLIVCE